MIIYDVATLMIIFILFYSSIIDVKTSHVRGYYNLCSIVSMISIMFCMNLNSIAVALNVEAKEESEGQK